jgi:hypothetical protein
MLPKHRDMTFGTMAAMFTMIVYNMKAYTQCVNKITI